uniref:Uncharacterized protein n=1 Tax=Macaca fascicularis TaxID=9541 RepID=A0A7N9D9I9_MACFA
ICLVQKSCSREHVHNMQVCYICINVPRWYVAPINFSAPILVSFKSV